MWDLSFMSIELPKEVYIPESRKLAENIWRVLERIQYVSELSGGFWKSISVYKFDAIFANHKSSVLSNFGQPFLDVDQLEDGWDMLAFLANHDVIRYDPHKRDEKHNSILNSGPGNPLNTYYIEINKDSFPVWFRAYQEKFDRHNAPAVIYELKEDKELDSEFSITNHDLSKNGVPILRYGGSSGADKLVSALVQNRRVEKDKRYRDYGNALTVEELKKSSGLSAIHREIDRIKLTIKESGAPLVLRSLKVPGKKHHAYQIVLAD